MKTYAHVQLTNQADWVEHLPIGEILADEEKQEQEQVAMAVGGYEIAKNPGTQKGTKALSPPVVQQSAPDGKRGKVSQNAPRKPPKEQ